MVEIKYEVFFSFFAKTTLTEELLIVMVGLSVVSKPGMGPGTSFPLHCIRR